MAGASIPDRLSPLTAHELERIWWGEWWSQDYSWDGLAQKQIPGFGTLQDFWRSESEHLLNGPKGRKFTRFHLPYRDNNGRNLDRAGHDEYIDDRLRQLILGVNTGGSDAHTLKMTATDFRLPFAGVTCLNAALRHLHGRNSIDASWSYCPTSLELTKLHLGPRSEFSNSMMKGSLRIAELTADALVAHNCRALGGIELDGGSVAGRVEFTGLRCHGDLTVSNLKVGDTLDISSAQLTALRVTDCDLKFVAARNAQMDELILEGDCRINSLGAQLSRFEKNLYIKADVEIEHVGLEQTSISSLSAVGARFGTFSARGAEIGELSLNGCKIRSHTTFEDAKIIWPATFVEVTFGGDVNFIDAALLKGASFERSKWGGLPNFHGAKLHKNTSFDRTQFIALSQAQNVASWGFLLLSTLVLALSLALPPHLSVWLIAPMLFVGAEVWTYVRTRVLPEKVSVAPWLFPKDGRLEALSRSLQVLTQIAADNRNWRDAARFHRGELIATRLRSTTSSAERVFSVLYDWASDYGESIMRCVASIIALTLAFAFAFERLDSANWTNGQRPELISVEAIELSATNVFRPFSVWDRPSTEATCSMRDRMLERASVGPCRIVGLEAVQPRPFSTLAMKVVSSVQSLLALAVLFLLGLTVRRKFQMN